MFNNKSLLSEGVKAQAIVVSSRGYGQKVNDGGFTGFHIDLEVHFADGTTSAVSRKEKKVDVGVVVTGQVVPVRHDAKDHSKVEVDVPAIKAARAAAHEATRARSLAQAHAELAHPTALDPTVTSP